MRIACLSDTHIPRAAKELPKKVVEQLEQADLVLHAGDFEELYFYEELLARYDDKLLAVCGNMDTSDLRRLLPNKRIVEVEGFELGLIHGWGAPYGLGERLSNEFSDVDIIVFGHSHLPTNYYYKNILLFNPGSPTDKIFATYNSFGILQIEREKGIKAEIIKI